MSLERDTRFYSGAPLLLNALVDCANMDSYGPCMTPIVEEGAPFRIYYRTGEVRRETPLVYQPPVNSAYPRAKGCLAKIPYPYSYPYYPNFKPCGY